MRLRIVTAAVVLAIGVLAALAWQRNATRPTPAPVPGDGTGAGPAVTGPESPASPAEDPGITWTVPGRWVNELAQGMRLASYAIPAAGDAGAAECAVYYFGPGKGGSVDANIERWIGEFDDPGAPVRRTRKVHGLRVTQVEVTGDYSTHAGAAEGGGGVQSGWTLLAAIVEGPRGPVFFKLTGPRGTVAAASKEFDGMIGSLRKP